MQAISYTAIRKNLAKTIDQVCDGHDLIIIKRRNKKSVVILSLEDFEALNETALKHNLVNLFAKQVLQTLWGC